MILVATILFLCLWWRQFKWGIFFSMLPDLDWVFIHGQEFLPAPPAHFLVSAPPPARPPPLALRPSPPTRLPRSPAEPPPKPLGLPLGIIDRGDNADSHPPAHKKKIIHGYEVKASMPLSHSSDSVFIPLTNRINCETAIPSDTAPPATAPTFCKSPRISPPRFGRRA